MKELAPLLEKLAKELGTTSTYLWGILLKQAPISGIIDLFQYALIVLGCFAWWKATKFTYTKVEKNDWDEIVYFPAIFVGIGLLILVICAFICIHDTISAFINPEYWAFRKILSQIPK